MRRLVQTLAIVGALVLSFLAPVRNAAGIQGNPTLYEVTQLGSLGGTSSAGNSINNRTWVAGTSNLPDDLTTHATLWRDGATIDLGTLGGPNSAVLWPVKSENGMIVGVAETAELDPLGESWSCSAFFPSVTGRTCLGFVWQDGQMSPLPTLGGNNGFATGANKRGEVVGWAENTVDDPTCNPPQVLQFRATVWDTRREGLRELPPLPGDTVTAATAINDQGTVVGISGICDNAVGRFSAAHAVLWDGGTGHRPRRPGLRGMEHPDGHQPGWDGRGVRERHGSRRIQRPRVPVDRGRRHAGPRHASRRRRSARAWGSTEMDRWSACRAERTAAERSSGRTA